MHVFTKEEYLQRKEFVVNKVMRGELFISPTDTIYRIHCDATNPLAVTRLREIKKHTGPFSVMAPSKQWVREHCHIPLGGEEYLDRLPGRYVLILRMKKPFACGKEVTSGLPTIAVRLPQSWSHEVAALVNRPLVSTAANIRGHSFMTSLDTLSIDLKSRIDFCLYDGELVGKKVSIIDLTRD